MKKGLVSVLSAATVAGLIATQAASPAFAAAKSHKPLAGQRIALVTPELIGDNPFFQQEDTGAKLAAKKLGYFEKTIQSSDSNSILTNLQAVAASNYNLIITSSFEAQDALTQVAKQYPKKHFVIIDAEVDLPNVTSILFKNQEGAFLLGAAAGLVTHTNKVGMVVAENIPLMSQWTSGFKQGLKYTNPKAKMLVNYVGSFSDPNKAKQLAVLQHSKGADFIAATAATGNIGVFDAAKQDHFYTAGQDTDQTTLDPKWIILSQLKGTDAAAENVIESFATGSLKTGVVQYGLKDGGDGLTFVTTKSKSHLSPVVGPKNVAKLKRIVKKIDNGQIKVIDPLATPAKKK